MQYMPVENYQKYSCASLSLTGGDVGGYQESADPLYAEHRWHLLYSQASFQLQQALHRCECFSSLIELYLF